MIPVMEVIIPLRQLNPRVNQQLTTIVTMINRNKVLRYSRRMRMGKVEMQAKRRRKRKRKKN